MRTIRVLLVILATGILAGCAIDTKKVYVSAEKINLLSHVDNDKRIGFVVTFGNKASFIRNNLLLRGFAKHVSYKRILPNFKIDQKVKDMAKNYFKEKGLKNIIVIDLPEDNPLTKLPQHYKDSSFFKGDPVLLTDEDYIKRIIAKYKLDKLIILTTDPTKLWDYDTGLMRAVPGFGIMCTKPLVSSVMGTYYGTWLVYFVDAEDFKTKPNSSKYTSSDVSIFQRNLGHQGAMCQKLVDKTLSEKRLSDLSTWMSQQYLGAMKKYIFMGVAN